METSYKYLDRNDLNALIQIQRQNLAIFEMQAAKHGPNNIPIAIINGIKDIEREIGLIEKELKKYENTPNRDERKKILIIDDDDRLY